MYLEREAGLTAVASCEQRHLLGLVRLQDLAPKKGPDGMMAALTELCSDVQDKPVRYVAHQSQIPRTDLKRELVLS